MTRVACIGEAMVELSLTSNPQIGFAGDTLNTAVYLKRAAPSLDVSFITRLGQDTLSTRLRNFAANQQIDVSGIAISPDRTVGLYAIDTDRNGERSFTYWRDRSAARQLFCDPDELAALSAFDVLYLSAITLAILMPPQREALMTQLGALAKAGRIIVFDSNYRPQLWENGNAAATITRALGICNIALPSLDDEIAIFGGDRQATLARLRALGIRDGALKCGAQGPVSLADYDIVQKYPPATHVLDTTAAGDSFNAGYLAARLTGKNQRAALRAGHELAREVIGQPGAITPIQ